MNTNFYDPNITLKELAALFPEASTKHRKEYLRALKKMCSCNFEGGSLEELVRARRNLSRYPWPLTPEDQALLDENR